MVLFLKNLIINFRIVDAIDILLMTTLVYWILIIIRGTKATYMLSGIGIGLLAIYFTSIKNFELFTFNWILKVCFSNLPLIIIVLFQSEIRKALTQLGRGPFFSKKPIYIESALIEELVKTSISLANKKIGALMVIERKANLSDYLETGLSVDSSVNRDLITSIFLPVSPIHDGAIVIQKGHITKVGCFLPLSMDTRISKIYGTRHRAAIGVTEEIDCVVIVISEERGTISVAVGGDLTKNQDANSLRETLTSLLA
jgi:uncharacterized protein (TIGR00159 family)